MEKWMNFSEQKWFPFIAADGCFQTKFKNEYAAQLVAFPWIFATKREIVCAVFSIVECGEK